MTQKTLAWGSLFEQSDTKSCQPETCMETHGVQLPPEMEQQNVELMDLYMAMEKEPHMSQCACDAFCFLSELWALGQKKKEKKRKRKGGRMLKWATSVYHLGSGAAGYIKPTADTHELFHHHCFTCEEMESES